MKKLAAIILMSVAIAEMFTILSFRNNECQHIYVATEPKIIKFYAQNKDNPEHDYFTLESPVWPKGEHEGKELICIKCLHKTHQILDYGK